MAGTSATKQRSLFQAYNAYGDTIDDEDEGINFTQTQEGDANALFRELIPIAPSTTDQAVNLSSFLTGCDSWGLQDETVGATGNLSYAPVAGASTKFQLPPGGAMVAKQNAGTPPTLYLSNTSSTDTLYIRIAAVGTR